MGWDRPLTAPVEMTMRNGTSRTLATIADAWDYILGTLTERAQSLPYWEHAGRLLLEAARPEAAEEAMRDVWDGSLPPG